MSTYELHSLKLPKLTGTPLKMFTKIISTKVGRSILLNSLLENGGIPKLRHATFSEPPTLLPLVRLEAGNFPRSHAFEPGPPPDGFPYQTARDYQHAYQQGEISPVDIAERVWAAIAASDQGERPMRLFIALNRDDLFTQAQASSVRHKNGNPLGPLDGVPVAVKDEVDMTPYPTTGGTTFLGKNPASEDSTVVARLRAAGALLIGKTNMHEFGVNPNGFNAHYGTVRNPYNLECDPGGSSSGPAATVSAGIAPLAVGADGGGSIRIPAALCGVVGLKPTFGRVCEFGAVPICWSVAHIGPIAASVEDTALGYWIMAGPDKRDANTLVQPSVNLMDWNRTDLQGVRVGIYPAWFNHADLEIVQSCHGLVDQFKQTGAEVIEIEVPYLDEMRIAHAITILSEMVINLQVHKEHLNELSDSVRINLIMGDELTAVDYLKAQQVRTRAMAVFEDIFQKVDIVLTPATAQTAPPFPKGGLPNGYSDLSTVTELMRFIVPPNVTGNPAISFPAGYDSNGLPIGMQAIGRHWEEHLLLRVAYTAEQVVQRRTPPNYYKIL
jgi:Asp-tRNA(Asn)/Glu-tRNA(Gln) amidotransferase A subunit family amidase